MQLHISLREGTEHDEINIFIQEFSLCGELFSELFATIIPPQAHLTLFCLLLLFVTPYSRYSIHSMWLLVTVKGSTLYTSEFIIAVDTYLTDPGPCKPYSDWVTGCKTAGNVVLLLTGTR
jgi:hypothetical protein